MKVLTANMGGGWVEKNPQDDDALQQDVATDEARRVLSDVFRCENLVVLTGLGTSLCVSDQDGQPAAPTMGALWDLVEAQFEAQADPKLAFSDLLALVGYRPNGKDIEALLSRCRLAESFLQGTDKENVSAFIQLAERVIVDATNFVRVNHNLPHHGEFLRRVARRSNRKARAKIFTTNYDLCFEESARQGRYVVIDGFSPTQPATFDAAHFSYDIVKRSRTGDNHELLPNVFHLYKLHGSINWHRDADGEIYKHHNLGDNARPLLIYPRNSKYELAFEQPYLEVINAFQTALREPNTGLLVAGFGFNDNHLSEPVLSALRSNLGLKVAVVGPCLHQFDDGHEGESYTNKYIAKFRQLAEAGDARIALVNCGFEELNQYIPDLVAESDLEQHYARLRGLDHYE